MDFAKNLFSTSWLTAILTKLPLATSTLDRLSGDRNWPEEKIHDKKMRKLVGTAFKIGYIHFSTKSKNCIRTKTRELQRIYCHIRRTYVPTKQIEDGRGRFAPRYNFFHTLMMDENVCFILEICHHLKDTKFA